MAFFVDFLKTLGLVTFPKIKADLFSIPKNGICINPKLTGVKFLISRKFEVTILSRISEEIIDFLNRLFTENISWVFHGSFGISLHLP